MIRQRINEYLRQRFKHRDNYALTYDSVITNVGITYDTIVGLNEIFPIRAVYVNIFDSPNRELIIQFNGEIDQEPPSGNRGAPGKT